MFISLKRFSAFIIFALPLFNFVTAQVKIEEVHTSGIQFFHGSFEEAKAKALKENKMIFMDAYAEWCGPCKRMAATVFTDDKVGQFFNDNFINLKMDMEKGEGPKLSDKFDVSAYPTLIFINEKGEQVHKAVGALDAEQFKMTGKQALGKIDNSKGFEKTYNEGSRDPDLVLNYIRALNRAGKPSLKIANDFLLKADASQPTTFKIIYESTTQSDSKIFDLLIKNKSAITLLYSPEQVNKKIENAINKTLDNAVQFKNAQLHEEAKEKMKTYFPDKAEDFMMDADMKFYKAAGDVKNFCKTCDTYAKKDAKNDARKLFITGKQMVDAFPYDKTVLTGAEKYLKRAAENGGLSEYYYWYAMTLLRNTKKDEALKAAEMSLKIAKESQPNYVGASEELVRKIKES